MGGITKLQMNTQAKTLLTKLQQITRKARTDQLKAQPLSKFIEDMLIEAAEKGETKLVLARHLISSADYRTLLNQNFTLYSDQTAISNLIISWA
jgi:hypothetical protein